MRPTQVVLLLVLACTKREDGAKPGGSQRVALTRIDQEQIALVPEKNQHPFCVVYSVNAKGLIRQLTMPTDDISYRCPAEQPVGGHTFRIPSADGKTRIFVLMSSEPVKVSSLTQQLLDIKNKQAPSVLDFRLAGAATLDILEFDPS